MDLDMHLIEILLPIRGADGTQLPDSELVRLRDLLTQRFGGLTAFLRAPADGIWHDMEAGGIARDEIAVIEVMAETIDRRWWAGLREDLEERLGQKELVIRSIAAERL
jgi:hypothetical protein